VLLSLKSDFTDRVVVFQEREKKELIRIQLIVTLSPCQERLKEREEENEKDHS